jgi:glycosyl transferase family 25
MRKVVINLASRRDRRREMERQLSTVNWQADFYDAIYPNDAGGFSSIGARGCFLSHLSVLRQARDDKVDMLMVLEDDLSFNKDFLDFWKHVEPSLLSQATLPCVIYLGHYLNLQGNGLVQLPPETAVLCTHFMVFTAPALSLIPDELEQILARPPGHADGGPMHVDGAYSTIRVRHPRLKTFAHAPALGFQRPSRTDIGERKFFDSIKVLRPLIGSTRAIKARIVQKI